MSGQKSIVEVKPVCFVLMPIADVAGYELGHFARVYEHLLKPAIINAGYTPVRADDTIKTDYIVVGIIQKIVESSLVLCDFSARNPNVMYELGIRHAFNKPVVLIKDRRTEKIFDIQGLRYTEYDETLRVDAVGKDVARISSAITHTANAKPEDMNSIVQLAGIKAAESPVNRTISADTELLLAAIGGLERRINAVEDMGNFSEANFVVTDKGFVEPGGNQIEKGASLYLDGNEVGILKGVDAINQIVLVTAKSGKIRQYSAYSPASKGLTDLPF